MYRFSYYTAYCIFVFIICKCTLKPFADCLFNQYKHLKQTYGTLESKLELIRCEVFDFEKNKFCKIY